MHRIVHAMAGLLIAAAISCPAHAAIVSASVQGFSVREAVHIAASPDKVYAALIQPAQWWDSAHTFSGDAKNLTLDARAGGCWCETLPKGGSVQHMVVLMAAPGERLRMKGAIGPLQEIAGEGIMLITLTPAVDGTVVTLTYNLSGYSTNDLSLLAPVVDSVMGEQTAHLKAFIETGSPDAKGH
jgi:uncharacterized protein YndB with AHSA1/START domain